MDQGKVIAAIGLTVAALVVAAAIGLGFRQAKDGCERLARVEGREVVDNDWWAKGDYCVTRDAAGVTHHTNETAWYTFLVVIAAIPVGMAAGGGAVVLYGLVRSRAERRTS